MQASHEPITATTDLPPIEGVDEVVDAHAAAYVDPGVGAMLRKRRIALGLSQSDVANVVKLPARRIEAMEMERWDELPDGPYLRGFLKNIARALNLDAATLIDRVDESLMRARNPDSILVAPGSTHATLPRRSGPAEGGYSGRTLVGGALAFALIAALIAWSGTDSFDRAVATGKSWIEARRAQVSGDVAPTKAARPQTRSEPIQSPMPGATTGMNAAAAYTTGPSEPAPQAAKAPIASDAAGQSRPGPVSASASASAAMRLQFSEEAWVEVRGADGQVLLSRLNAAGTEQSIEGEPPFALVVGNARGVALSYRGQSVDLAPYTRDEVARFTLS